MYPLRSVRRRFPALLIIALLVLPFSTAAQDATKPPTDEPADVTQRVTGDEPKRRPRFMYLRFDDDFTYLRGEEGTYTPDWGDALKQIDLGNDWRMDVGGEFRFRMESRSNARFGRNIRTNNTEQFYRWFLHTNITYRDIFRVFVQGAVVHAEDHDGPFTPLHENHGDLQQLFFDVRLGEGSPFILRVGRQELNYGNQRYLSALEWASTRRRFDAVALIYKSGDWRVDGFYAKPVVVKRDQGDDWNEDFDFGGVYATYKGIPDHGLDFYGFAIDRTENTVNPNGNAGDQSVYTLGTRFWGKTNQWDYEAELAGQWGRWAGDTVQAWSWTIDTGYTFDQFACKPRIGAGFDWASGDENPTDGKVGTFNQLFPLGHKYLGFLDLIGRQNINAVNVNLSAWAVPKKVKARVAWHTFWLNDSHDALYNAGGAPVLRDVTGDSGEQVGHELDLTVSWRIDPHSTMLFGYSHFWNNSFVHGVVRGDDDPNLFYVQYQFKF